MFLWTIFLSGSVSLRFGYANGDIIFVTQTPTPNDFANIVATFGNQRASIAEAPRGGDLYIRYDDGSLKNLTRAAGFGSDQIQGANAIAVRDPAVHWSGTKVLFSMVVGAPSEQYQARDYYWQIYELAGLGKNDTPVISKVANQPENYNNVMPVYATDDQILFASDRPRNGERHLYPQRDEYESTATNSGLWKLNPASGALTLLDHSPSGIFSPIVDSFGRVIYTRWDHLQQDQQADADGYGAFNYSDESAAAVKLAETTEVFPEPRSERRRLSAILNLHTINFFFPWQINEDGTELETLNHIGRHELVNYFNRSFNDDGNLIEFYDPSPLFNQNRIESLHHIQEDPRSPGMYFGINGPEFSTHASGQIVRLSGAPSLTADRMGVDWITHPDTAGYTDSPSVNHSGLYRDPLPLSSGALIAAHTANTLPDQNVGSGSAPRSRFDFRLKQLTRSGNYYIPASPLTPGISRNLQWWSPDVLMSYTGLMWELQPVEVRATTRPVGRSVSLDPIEADVFAQAGVDVGQFRNYLRQHNLALIVTRNVTSRDSADRQQPFNLRVVGTSTQTIGAAGRIYDVAHLQIFQGDQIRGYGGTESPSLGRRVLAQPMHDVPTNANLPNPGAAPGSVKIAADGSVAALVPAQRAVSWQLSDPSGNGIVRERFWLTFQPGEIRVCASCHGLNSRDQIGQGTPTNPPQALRDLLAYWRQIPPTTPPAEPPSGQPGTPPPSTPPGNGSDGPAVTLRAVGWDAQLVPHFDRLYSGRPGAFELRGLRPGESMQIQLTVNSTSCTVRRVVVANSSGIGRLRGALSGPSRRSVALLLTATQNGVIRTRGAATLLNTRGRPSNVRLPKRERDRLCQAFAKFR